MEFGISLSLACLPLPRAMPLASLAERCGLPTVSVGEAAHDSFAAATAMATSTETTRIMTGVTTWVRPPILTATAAGSMTLFGRSRPPVRHQPRQLGHAA